MKSNHLIDVFDDVLTNGGIFNALSLLDVPWKNDVDDTALDLEYYGNISGQKFVSPLLCRLLGYNEKLTNENITTLANVLFSMFGRNWTELYETLSYEYDPISNYDMTETETSSGSTSDTLTHTGTQNTLHTGTVGTSDTQTVNGSGTGSTENDVWGFNSSSAIEDNLSETETTNTNTATGSSTQTNNLSDARTDNLTDTGTGSHSDTRTLTRSGNIGVTTSQQMIQSQRDLWVWNFIYNVVFPDVDKVLTISTYSNR